jgi:hypothetical protein
MRNKYISKVQTIIEKEFWKQFFIEVDKRTFVKDKFGVKDFGFRINNKHLKKPTKSYSLMYTRNGSFKINKQPYNGEHWDGDGLKRLKNWCTISGLPEKFYSELNKRKLLSLSGKNSEIIDIPLLLKSKTPSQLVDELFQCIDLFQ